MIDILPDMIDILPDELLLLIFRSVRPEAQILCKRQVAWIALTHVCRAWRALALSEKRLWTKVDFGWSENAVSAFLQRSGTLPLSVTGFLTTKRLGPWMTILEHVDRIGVFTLSGGKDLKHLLSLANRPARSLVRFEILGPQEVPSDLFAGMAPNLRHFTATGVRPPIGASVLKGLSAMYINRLYGRRINRDPDEEDFLTCEDTLSLLDGSPALTSLSLTHWCNHARAAPIARRSHHPNLRDLSLVGTPSEIAHLLTHMALVDDAVVTFTFELPLDEPEELDYSATLPSVYAQPSPSFVHNHFSHVSADFYEGEAAETEISFRCHGDKAGSSFALMPMDVESGRSVELYSAALKLWAVLPIQHLKTLNWTWVHMGRCCDLAKALRHADQLERITVSSHGLPAFIGATRGPAWCQERCYGVGYLGMEFWNGWASENTPLVLPALRSVTLRTGQLNSVEIDETIGADDILEWFAFIQEAWAHPIELRVELEAEDLDDDDVILLQGVDGITVYERVR